MKSSDVLRISVLCFTMVCWSNALSSKRKPFKTLKGFREDYASLAETCKIVGFEKSQCPTDRGFRVIAFSASMSASQLKMGTGHKVKFSNVILNEGDGYNGRSSIFTAPVKGFYVFNWTIMTNYRKYVYTGLQAHGKYVVKNHCNPANTHQLCSAMGIVKLGKGDRVWIQTSSGNDNNAFGTNLASHFSGYRL